MSIYVLDSAAILDLHMAFAAPRLREKLKALAKRHELKIPEGVFRELRRRTDKTWKCLDAVRSESPDIEVCISRVPQLGHELARIERSYGERIRIGSSEFPGFFKSGSGRKAIDGQVIAVAKKLQGTVVSDDKAIQRTCLCENVECLIWTEFARRLGLSHQPGLFPEGGMGT